MSDDDYGYRLAFCVGGARAYDAPTWSFSVEVDNLNGRPCLIVSFLRWEAWVGWRLVRDEERPPAEGEARA